MKPTQVALPQRLSEESSDAAIFTTVGEMVDPYIVARFTVDGEPQSKARAKFTIRNGKPRTYTPDATTRAEAVVLAEYLKVARPEHRKDATNTFGVVAVFHVTEHKRDVDNMVKLILDALNGWAWKDDRQVSEIVGRKVSAWPSDAPRTDVAIYRTGVTRAHGVEIVCRECGKSFHVPPSAAERGKQFCSGACRNSWRRKRSERTCRQCGERFEARARDQRHCSKECFDDSSRVDAICAACGTEFRKPRYLNRSGNSYCSPECKATYWREQRKSAAKGTCLACGGPTTKKTYKRCRDCHYAAGGRWADKSAESVKCSACGSFMGPAGCSRCRKEEK